MVFWSILSRKVECLLSNLALLASLSWTITIPTTRNGRLSIQYFDDMVPSAKYRMVWGAKTGFSIAPIKPGFSAKCLWNLNGRSSEIMFVPIMFPSRLFQYRKFP